jgi:hypothetical protein
MLNGMGRDRGAASALDQAILPQIVSTGGQTWALAWYNVVLDARHALGALAAAIPTFLMRVAETKSDTAHRATFLMCGLAMLLCIVPYRRLTRDYAARPLVRPRQHRRRLSQFSADCVLVFPSLRNV